MIVGERERERERERAHDEETFLDHDHLSIQELESVIHMPGHFVCTANFIPVYVGTWRKMINVPDWVMLRESIS
jgi:hypothetical protein